jgi:quercetin dioxygenase-like cupin family protein
LIFDNVDNVEAIRQRVPFWGSLPGGIPWNWDRMMNLLDTHPGDLYDRVPSKFRVSLNKFHARASAPIFSKDIVHEMITTFNQNNVTNIAFIGFGKDSESYPWHKDTMDVFLLQVLGTIDIKVEGCGEDPRKFSPGQFVWIPRGTHHLVLPNQSRATFSFGVEGTLDPSKYI